MALLPLPTAPGVCLSASNYSAHQDGATIQQGNAARSGMGRWVSGSNVEFIAGYAQKIAGWAPATADQTVGIPRAEAQWRGSNGNVYTAIGTESHLYTLLSDTLTDVTPLRQQQTGTLTNPITTTSGSDIVRIADASQALEDDDWVYLSAASAVGGVTLDGWYQVVFRDATGYSVTVPVAASGSAGPGGGSVIYQYPRVSLTDPFTTVIGTMSVTVTQTNHNAATGDYVVYSGATAVGGVVIDGEYQVQSVINADSYTINSGTLAASSATGGGVVSVIYLIGVQQSSYAGGVGYGTGAYGVGPYGYGASATAYLANGWTLGQYGYLMLAAPIGGTIYIIDPASGGRAYPLLNAPSVLNAMFVTPERFVVALGINGNPMQMAWCDQNDFTDWTATAANTANDGRTLIGGNFFVAGLPVRNGVSLVWSDRCIFEMTYDGTNEVYATKQVGDNCGLNGVNAACAEGGVAYWFSDKDFWQWNGSVSSLPSDDIRSEVFSTINPQQLQRCVAALNRAKLQVRFWYPSGSETENDVGVLYQYDSRCWSVLAYGRTAAIDAQLLPKPMSTDTAGFVFYDETGADANGVALEADLEMGMMDISNGDRNVDVFGLIPDFKTLSGNISFYALTKFYPADVATEDGPYTLTSATPRLDLRADGKMFAYRLACTELGATFRLGLPRLDVQPSGARN